MADHTIYLDYKVFIRSILEQSSIKLRMIFQFRLKTDCKKAMREVQESLTENLTNHFMSDWFSAIERQPS